MTSTNVAAQRDTPDFLADGGEMGALMRAHDWASTSLGPSGGWPRALKTAVRLILNTGHPMYVWWGPKLLCFYNDAYRRTLGPERHPGSLGRPGREVWAEIWHLIGDQVDFVMAGRGSTWDENRPVPTTRFGRLDEIYWTYSYSPIDDETAPGGVGGVLVVCAETTQAVLAERRRAAETERQRRLFEQAPGFVTVLADPDHVFEFANAAYRRLIGGRDPVGKTVRETLPELEGQGFFDLLDRVYTTGKRHVAERSPIRLEGPGTPAEERFLDFIYEPIIDEAGRVTGIFVEGHDVTDARRAEAELRKSEERNRRIVEGVKDHAIFTTDSDGTVVDWTPGAEAVFQWAAREIEGRNSELLFTSQDRDAGVPAQELFTAHEEGCANDERWHVRRDGSRFFANGSVRPLHSTDGEVAGFIKIARDETARRAAEANLRETEARLREMNDTLEQQVEERTAELRLNRDIVQADQSLIVAFDHDFRVTTFNRAHAEEFFRVFGHRQSMGEVLPALFPPEQAEVLRSFMARALTGESFTVTASFGDPDRAQPPFEVTYYPLKDEEGRIVGAFHHARNISDRLRAQTDLDAAHEQLRQAQKMEAMGQLTGGVAHDFNNLLTPIVGSLDMLQRRNIGGEREQRLIAGAMQSADRARTLVQRLLAFARRQPLQPSAVDVGRLVEGMADLLASTTGPQVRVSVEVAPDLPPAKADPNQLEMALLNLGVNARDAMPDGGTLRISATRQSVRTQQGELRPGHYVRLSVADTGFGMDEATLARAVEPFFSTKGIGKGTGLGLSMVHGLAAQLGGTVTIQSRRGVGTNVELWLPVSATPLHDAEARSEQIEVDGARGLVLLVDDEEVVRMSTADMLADFGYRVLEADSGEAALALVGEGAKPDLLVTDHLMPGMSGVDLARALRESVPDLPVLIVSGYAESEGIAPDLPRLTKPFRSAELAASLSAVTSSAS